MSQEKEIETLEVEKYCLAINSVLRLLLEEIEKLHREISNKYYGYC